MKLKLSIALILSIFILLIAVGPTFAEDSRDIKNSTYGIDKTQTTAPVIIPKKRTYAITPNSRPCDKKILKYSTYNRYTKNYYTLISYMKKFEKSGGGTLVLKKGTYTISSTVPVPSNVNIIMNDGVVIKKGTKTGTRKFKASTTIFQIVHPSKLKRNGAYSRYNGVRNVNLIGKGNVVINLRYIKNNHAIVCGHNTNIKIQGITFKNSNCGHFLEVDATNGIKISNCKFISSKASPKFTAEAINLDTPDRNTNGFHNPWSKYDKTPNCNVFIENNLFLGLDRAIGTHKYSQRQTNGRYVTDSGQVYHTNIIIRNNRILYTRSDAIRVLNWKDSEIVNNYIAHVKRNSLQYRAVLASGAVNLKVKNNYFYNMQRPVQILVTKNVGDGSMYSATYNHLTRYNYYDLQYNLCVALTDTFARVSNRYNDYSDTIMVYMLTGYN